MTRLFKNSKQVLSFVLAFAVLAVSLFTGVVINSEAAVTENVIYYGGGVAEGIASTAAGTEEDPIIIASAKELAYLAKLAGDSSKGKYYKMADDIDVIVLQNESHKDEIMAIASADDAKAKIDGYSDKKYWYGEQAFQGHFDGNGVEIYGLYGPSGALFPKVNSGTSFKNFAIKNSYVTSADKSGALIASLQGGGNGNIVVENVEISNCYVESKAYNSGTPANTDRYRVGVMVGSYYNYTQKTGLIINNCLVYGNKAVHVWQGTENNGELTVGGLIGSMDGGYNYQSTDADTQISNSIILDCVPYSSKDTASYNATHPENFSNVYTNCVDPKPSITNSGWGGTAWENFSGKIIEVTADGVKGAAGKDALALDWSNEWLANAGIPELRALHEIDPNATKTENGHIETCTVCGLVGLETDHTYDANDVCTACGDVATFICGTRVASWDGSVATGFASTAAGTEEDPIIIASAAELAYLANGADGATSGKFYKISDKIDALVLQPAGIADAIMALDSADAVQTYFEANKSSVRNWVEGASGQQTTVNFDGTLDGNGAIIYGMYSYSKSYAGLLPGAHNCTIKNLGMKNNYVYGDRAALISANSNEVGTLAIDGGVYTNNVLLCNRNNDGSTCAGLFTGANSGGNTWNNVTGSVNNVLVYGNKVQHTEYSIDWKGDKFHEQAYDMDYALFGTVSGMDYTVTNSIVLDTAPYTIAYTSRGFNMSSYSNVYTNMLEMTIDNVDWTNTGAKKLELTTNTYINDDGTVDIEFRRYEDGSVIADTESYNRTFEAGSFILVDADTVKGAAGKNTMAALDWDTVWFANEGVPALRAFHNSFSAVDNGDGTHSESCNCGIKGVAASNHVFDKTAADGVCTVCGAGCEHKYVDGTVKAEGNCTTDRVVAQVCEKCGHAGADKTTTAAGHKFELKAEVAATCKAEGTKAHNHCTVCDKNFAADADKMSTTVVADADLVIGITAHTATTDASGIVYNMSADGHAKKCSVCGEEFDKEAHVGDYTKDAEGHTGTCSVCKMATTGKEAHVFGDDSVCDTCNWECTSHKYVDGEETILMYTGEATPDACTKVAQKCEICGIAGKDKINGHTAGNWEKPFFDRTAVPSCAGEGSHSEVQICTVCFFEMGRRTVTDPKSGHVYTEYEAMESTCTMPGNIAYKYCANCNYSFAADAADDEPYENALEYSDYTLDLDSNAHTWVEYECTADCVNDGVVAHKFCTDCYLLVVDGKETDVEIDWETFHKVETDENWNSTPIGIGAKLDAELPYIENELFAEYVAENYPDLGVEVPAYPENTTDWDAMNEYYDAHYEVTLALDAADENWRDAWGEYWTPILEELQTEAYHEALLLAAEEAGIDMVAPADPEAHAWEEVEAEAATCEEPGCVAHKVCSNCLLAVVDGKEIQLEIDWDALYDEVVEINPDDYNSEDDYYAAVEEIAIKYTYAAYEKAGILIPAAHKLSEVKEVAATTEKEGTKAHYACSECDKLFADAEGEKEVKAEDLVIAKLTKTDNNTDKGDKSPATGESVAAVAAVAALVGAAFVIARKARKA